ncbi:hypothetical protein CYMTET_12757 [Cymbomonas tetramitiformis]|uniref:40S ribosomal protein S3 n=1 Tax=Cymbomonas tetramitiformis TaxID=36881 RepID=A0AAE0GK12_9CHLO|nr:hypothetical protein CYMTET_12757 [Cymbomonas tetramitiformis]
MAKLESAPGAVSFVSKSGHSLPVYTCFAEHTCNSTLRTSLKPRGRHKGPKNADSDLVGKAQGSGGRGKRVKVSYVEKCYLSEWPSKDHGNHISREGVEADQPPNCFRTFIMANVTMSKKRKFVADGVFFAELNELLTRELAEDGYSGVEVRVTPMRTEIIIRATRTQSVLGEKGRRIRELTFVVQKRFGFAEGSVELYAEKVANRGLCAVAQCESLRYKLVGGLAVRRACYGVLRFVMESGAKGCEVIVSGKLRAQRAKSMKFKDGYMISSGAPTKEYIDRAVRHVMLRQGVLGIKVKIMLDWDPTGKNGPKMPMPDMVKVLVPKEDEELGKPYIGKVSFMSYTLLCAGASNVKSLVFAVKKYPGLEDWRANDGIAGANRVRMTRHTFADDLLNL